MIIAIDSKQELQHKQKIQSFEPVVSEENGKQEKKRKEKKFKIKPLKEKRFYG